MSSPIKKRVTRLLHSGRPESGWVNVPPTRASTYVFKSVADWKDTRNRRELERLPSYGARGNDTGHALEDALVELEQGHRCFLFPTGQAAIATALLAFLKPGGHLLISDAVYEPVRNFCKHQLDSLGIEYSFYATDGNDIESKLRPNTRVLYIEAPGTMTYDMVDLPKIAELVAGRDLVIVADNTWGSGWLYQPLVLGADISIMATTKYVGGHSDIMMGSAVANKRTWQQLQKAVIGFGQTTSPDDAFLALRGLRSMPVRLKVHGESALKVAKWLTLQPEVHQVFFPGLESDANHRLWKKYCMGSNGLVSFELQRQYSREKVERMIDALSLFGLGASWGGFESLVIPADLAGSRVLSDWSQRGVVVRLHIGLEDTEDLIEDLQQALQTLH
jgi:cystathionine beta-lyase